MQSITIKKGLDIAITGKPEQKIGSSQAVTQVALVATEFIGLKPKILVVEGQAVGLGEPLFIDKHDEQIQFVSPGTGRVVAINRGRRRKLKSIVIEIDDQLAKQKTFATDSSVNTQDLRGILLRSGLWTGFRTRPFNRIPNSHASPSAVFVTATDTRPLAAKPNIVIAHQQSDFIKGMHIIRQLGDWPVHLCTAADWSGPTFEARGISHCTFKGPHPAGLVGTHIHHLNPVSAGRVVWHIGYQDVIAIGHLFQTGRLLTERIVSIGGANIKKPRLIKTRLGANINQLINQELTEATNHRVLSGSVLDGTEATGALAYLGRYDNQISVIPNQLSTHHPSWFSRLLNNLHSTNTSSHGRPSAMVPVEAFERIMPLAMLVTPLLRALLVIDTVAAESLGCLELAEEDLALSSYVCPAKQDYATALRINLNQIEQEGWG
jgi:Na+-transporting NADH:ubiquinone oxidoreductase subunit A